MLNDQFRQALEAGDVAMLRRIWAHAMPHLPQPRTEAQARIVMHHARTAANSMPLAKRAYSHAWCLDHGVPSALPDRLKPAAERLYPRVAKGVGIAVSARGLLAPAGALIQRAMSEAVEDLAADGVDLDSPRVRERMAEVRDRTVSQLFGRPLTAS